MKKRLDGINNIKKWKIVKIITIVILMLFIIRLIIDAIMCIKMTYPHPMLGIETNNWVHQFFVDIIFILITWSIPLIIDVILLVISCVKIKKNK